MSRSRRRRKRLKAILVCLALPLSVLLLYGAYLYVTLTLPAGEDRQPLRIYGAPLRLTPGMKLDPKRLQDRLNHLGYRSVARGVQGPGQYRLSDRFLDIYLRDFDYPEGLVQGQPVRLVLDDGRLQRVLHLPDEAEIGSVSLEPQLIGGLLASSRQVREWIPLSAMPIRLIDAVLATEDHRYYSHCGIDPLAILRATWENLRSGMVIQGGSTITQQLAKNLYYSPQRTVLRKLMEAIAAVVLEIKYTKKAILESYLNEIYLGQWGSVALYGVGEASRHYFGKPVQELTVAESALLAGMIKAPNTYTPIKDAQRAKKRRDLVLERLYQQGKLSEKTYQAALATPVRVIPLQQGITDAPYFVDYLLSHLEDSIRSAPREGLRIFTTLDPELQRIAEEAVSTGLARLETRYPFLVQNGERLQGGLVALDPRTGGILAMVGGRDYRSSQFNHAVQARRQAGSLFKPFIYLAAFERSLSSRDEVLSPLTMLSDTPLTFPNGSGTWSPQNYDRRYRGEVTVRTALEQSLNIPAVRMAQRVGVDRIIRLLRNLGIKGPLEANLTLALGSADVSLLEITGAYAALADAGRFIPPTALRAVVKPGEPLGGRHGEVIALEKTLRIPVISPQAAYLVTSFLKGVVERGTAAEAKAMGLTAAVAGKTGTTDDHRDAWFVGYTPDVALGVWIGFDGGSSLHLTGAQAALPIWVEFFRKALPPESEEFPVPPGIIFRAIDTQTLLLANSSCPEVRDEVFLEGTEPTTFCNVHSPGILERLRRLFGT